MNGRLFYYLKKTKKELSSRGAGAVAGDAWSFLIRRRFGLQFLFESFEYCVLARFRDEQKTIVDVLKNDLILSKRVLIYANYDSGSCVLPHVVEQLTVFHRAGYSVIFVSTSPKFFPDEFTKIENLVAVAIHRKNVGYDFTSWKVGFSFIAKTAPSLQSLVLMNDSCLGPFFDFAPLLEKMFVARESVFGLSKSDEIAEHIQSYFYHFGGEVLRAGVVAGFFDRIRVLNTKWGIVRYFEIGSSRFLASRGIALQALVDAANPDVKAKMDGAGISEPTREPLASEWVKTRVNPFYKRSNLKSGQEVRF